MEDDGGGEDRLSALPDDVLIDILVKLEDAAAAARTSVLAPRWRRLWALLPEINFDDGIEHRRIGPALAAHEALDFRRLEVATGDASPGSVSAWLPAAARRLSGSLLLLVVRRDQAAEDRAGAAVDLPCFEKATSVALDLGFLALALPASGVFARLKHLYLVGIQLRHGSSDGSQSKLGDAVSSPRCPSLQSLYLLSVRNLEDNFAVHSETLLRIELWALHDLQQLTVVAPALEKFIVQTCFTDAPNPCEPVANISAPQLVLLDWMVAYNPTSVQLGKLAHLHSLGIELSVLDGEYGEDVEAFANNHHRIKHLRGYERILDSLNIVLSFPPEIGSNKYSMEDMPRLPKVVFLALGISSYGHSFAASSFDVLRSCPGIKRLDLDFLPGSPPEERTPCPSGCVCHHRLNWRTDELVLNCLEEVEIHDFSGTEYEVALVKKLFDWATVLNLMTVYFVESITESKAEELRQLLLSFSRPDICMNVSMFVP